MTQQRQARQAVLPGEDVGVIGPAVLLLAGLTVVFWAAFFAEGWL